MKPMTYTPAPNLIPMPSATMLRIVKLEGCSNCRTDVSQVGKNSEVAAQNCVTG